MPNKKKLSTTAQLFSSDHHPLLNHPINFGFAIYSVVAVAVSTMVLLAVYFAGYSSGLAYTNQNSTMVGSLSSQSLTVAQMTEIVEQQLDYKALAAVDNSLDIQSELTDTAPAPVIAVAETYPSDQAFLESQPYLDPRADSNSELTYSPLDSLTSDFWMSMAIIVFALGSVVATINYLDEQHLLRKGAFAKTTSVKKSTKTGRYTATKKKAVKKKVTAKKVKVKASSKPKKAVTKRKTSAKKKVSARAKR